MGKATRRAFLVGSAATLAANADQPESNMIRLLMVVLLNAVLSAAAVAQRMGVKNVLVSLSHARGFAVASVVLERD